MGKKYIYADEKSIMEIDNVLNLATKVLETDFVFINDEKNVPPIVGAALAGTLTAVGKATAGIGGTVAVTTGIGGASFIASGATAAVGTTAAIIAAPAVIITGAALLILKNKNQKKLNNMRLARYKEAVKKQSMAIKKFMELDKKREENEKIMKDDIEKMKMENTKLRNKLNELRAINESLLAIIEGLGKDIQIA